MNDIELQVDTSLPIPPSQQVQTAILDAVARGALKPGDRLPSVRSAAAQALVNPNTINKAWRSLEGLGVVEGRNGSGVYVAQGGLETARLLRSDATLDEFRRSAAQALRAGHDPAALQDLLSRVVTAEEETVERTLQ